MNAYSIVQQKGLQHFAVWILLFVLLVVSNTSMDLLLSVLLSLFLVAELCFVTLVNRHVLIPCFLEKMGVLVYIAVAVLLFVVSIVVSIHVDGAVSARYATAVHEDFVSPLDTNLPSETKQFFEQDEAFGGVSKIEPRFPVSASMKITFLFIGTFLFNFFSYYSGKQEKELALKNKLERERAEMELRFLRSQINPHFLFNALNNIYSMVYTGDKNAPDCILVLSDMLRYVTDGSKQNRILLRDEVSYIENFIRFQSYSFEKKVDLVFEKDIENELVYISPMLLQPFVENSFKYSGLGMNEEAFLHIMIKMEKNVLYFETRNSKFVKQKKGKTEREGVGMENVMKRLELLYSGAYSLKIEEDEHEFTVKLSLETDKKQ